MSRRTLVAHAVIGALLLTGTAQASLGAPSRARHDTDRRDLDLTASAHPSTANPVVGDEAYAAATVHHRDVKADNTATSSATCDGCTAESASLQILYVVGAGQAQLDNSATAWSQACVGCTSTALSVQVVVLRGAPATTPSNRAFAVNAACETCRTTAAAFQLVVVADRARRLSDGSVAELRSWFEEQLALLRAPVPTPNADPTTTAEPTPNARRRDPVGVPATEGAQALGFLEELVNSDLGSDTVSADVEQTIR